ncbi:MAG: hypothetical protein P8Q35_03910 [Candidatus Thalassarchaeaceae archaeon]|jgi:hypothetical protein|nr:hypothetical protein [Candidatus Thalassarchaeaceae archaeon]
MPTCRLCRSVYPQEHFISGNGPRYLVCARCGVENGYCTEDEAPQLYDDATVRARLALIGGRYAPILWLIMGWVLWTMFFSSLPLWGKASLVILIIATLAVPVMHLLGGPKFQAQLRRLTPK